MECVSGWFEGDGPDRTSWSEMSWNLDKRRKAKVSSKGSHCVLFIIFGIFSQSVCYFCIFISLTLMSYDITSPTDPSFSSSSLTVHEELHCWVIESMLFIKSIFLASLALLSLFVFTSLPFHLSLLPFFFIIDSPGTCSLQLFITSPFFPFYLVSLSDSPEAGLIVSVRENR